MNTTDVVMTTLDEAQLSLRNFEFDAEQARRHRNDAVLALLNVGTRPARIAERLGVSRAAVSKMAAAARAARGELA